MLRSYPFFSAVLCTQCTAGTFCTVGSASATTCAAGYYSQDGADSCLSCNAGSQCADPALPVLCVSGQYSLTRATACIPCPAGKLFHSGHSGHFILKSNVLLTEPSCIAIFSIH